MRQAAESGGYGIEEVEGEAQGLDADDVIAMVRDDESTYYAWVDERFQVALSIAAGVTDVDAGFRGVPVAVDQVAAALTSS